MLVCFARSFSLTNHCTEHELIVLSFLLTDKETKGQRDEVTALDNTGSKQWSLGKVLTVRS